jgi:hypothetical protein
MFLSATFEILGTWGEVLMVGASVIVSAALLIFKGRRKK